MKLLWAVLSATLMILIYLIFRPTPAVVLPVATQPAPSTPTSTLPPRPVLNMTPSAQRNAPAPVLKVETVRYTTKPKNRVVEFKMQEGLAIAYGDVIIGQPSKDFTGTGGFAEIPRPLLWKRGEIPYLIQSDVVKPERVEAAIQLFHTRTGLKFVPYVNQEDAIVFTKGQEHCVSFLGKMGGLQPIFLSEECGPANIAHEIMHALGFPHEQSRTDRDQYVTILWPNIEQKYHPQYAMVPDSLMEVYGGSPFDPSSILMYNPHAFAVTPEVETMKLKNGDKIKTSPLGLSESDVERVNRLYQN